MFFSKSKSRFFSKNIVYNKFKLYKKIILKNVNIFRNNERFQLKESLCTYFH